MLSKTKTMDCSKQQTQHPAKAILMLVHGASGCLHDSCGADYRRLGPSFLNAWSSLGLRGFEQLVLLLVLGNSYFDICLSMRV